MVVKALEEGYAFLIGGGADEDAKAEMGEALKKRALRRWGCRSARRQKLRSTMR